MEVARIQEALQSVSIALYRKLRPSQDKTGVPPDPKEDNCIEREPSDPKNESIQESYEGKYKASLVFPAQEVENCNKGIGEISSPCDHSKGEEMVDDGTDLDKCLDSLTEQGDDGSWICNKCGKKDRSKFHLRRHAETHVEGFKHPCTFCEREFSQRVLVKAHVLRAHSEERAPKPYSCDICKKPSASMSAVKIHKQRRHFGILV